MVSNTLASAVRIGHLISSEFPAVPQKAKAMTDADVIEAIDEIVRRDLARQVMRGICNFWTADFWTSDLRGISYEPR